MAKKSAAKKRQASKPRPAAPKARNSRPSSRAKAKRTTRKRSAAARRPAKATPRGKSAKKGAKVQASRPAPRKGVGARVAAKSHAPAVRRKAGAKAAAPKVARKVAKTTRVATAVTAPAKAAKALVKVAPKAPKAAQPKKSPALQRERRSVKDAVPVPSAPSSLVPNQHASAASSGSHELRDRLAAHTGSGPEITAGDVDANWESAESVGDEAPGGDNPTPGQDVVDEIGRALGVEYDDDEELQGGDEIAARDHDRWELDPASSDDFDER
jgi:Family of unknown function (DUF6335)